MIRRRIFLTALLIALPAAVALAMIVDRVRMRDMARDLERVVRSQINDQVRERCESDPTWFLTGPLIGRPPQGVFDDPNPDAMPPRPKIDPQPFELFAYDEGLLGSSSAAARMPPEFRRALLTNEPASGSFATDQGTGVQVAVPTGWRGGPCMYFLGRMQPPPNQLRQRLTITGIIFTACILVALLVSAETVRRIRRLAQDVRNAVDAGYTAIGPDKLRDELSSLTFVYNDAADALRDRKSRIEDQDVIIRRFVQSMSEEMAQPLVTIERELGELAARGLMESSAVNEIFSRVHALAAHGENLAAVARLKLNAPLPTEPIDLGALVTRVASRHEQLARSAGVTLRSTVPGQRVAVIAEAALLERAISNVVDNAIRYNRPGGDVTMTLTTSDDGQQFRLWVADNGRGITAEEFKGLTAIRRFRGDEGRNRRPGTPGLGLAIAREVADRLGLQLDLKRPGSGGMEVEFSGRLAPV